MVWNMRLVWVLVALLVGAGLGIGVSASVDQRAAGAQSQHAPNKHSFRGSPLQQENQERTAQAIQAAQVTAQVALDTALQASAKGAGPLAASLAKPPTNTANAQSNVQLIDSAFALGIKGRDPSHTQATFDADVGQVWAWIRVANPSAQPTHVTLVWRHGQTERARVQLEVGAHAKGWRTWSSKRIMAHEVGAWSVDVLDAHGEHVKTLSFTVQAPAQG